MSTVFPQEASYHARYVKRVVPPQQGTGGKSHLIVVDVVTRKNMVDRAYVGSVSSLRMVRNHLTAVPAVVDCPTFGVDGPVVAPLTGRVRKHRMLSSKCRVERAMDTRSRMVSQPSLPARITGRCSASPMADAATCIVNCLGRDA